MRPFPDYNSEPRGYQEIMVMKGCSALRRSPEVEPAVYFITHNSTSFLEGFLVLCWGYVEPILFPSIKGSLIHSDYLYNVCAK